MTLLQKTQILSKHHHSRGSKADHLAFFMVLLFSMWGSRKRGLITTTDAYDSCAFCQEPGMYRKKPTGSNATQAHLCNCRAWAHQQLRCSKLGYKPPAYQQCVCCCSVQLAYQRSDVPLRKCHTTWSKHVQLAVTVASLWFSSISLWADHKVPISFSC